MTKTYQIAIAGLRSRSASTLRNAEIALGQMMTLVPNGTAGTITHNGDLVITGIRCSLGWTAAA